MNRDVKPSSKSEVIKQVAEAKGLPVHEIPIIGLTPVDEMGKSLSSFFVLVVTDGGIMNETRLFADETDAVSRGRERWQELTDSNSMHENRGCSPEDLAEPGYNAELGCVQRCYLAHWFNDDVDIWVQEVRPE